MFGNGFNPRAIYQWKRSVNHGGIINDRNTLERSATLFSFPVYSQTKIHQGALVALNVEGFAVPASAVTTIKCVGRAEHGIDNTYGENGAVQIQVKRGCFKYATSDAITLKNVGEFAYATDDQTVGLESSAKSIAGVIRDVEHDGVWIEI